MLHAAIRPLTHTHTYLCASPPLLHPHKAGSAQPWWWERDRERSDSCLSDHSGPERIEWRQRRSTPILLLYYSSSGLQGGWGDDLPHTSSGRIGRLGVTVLFGQDWQKQHHHTSTAAQKHTDHLWCKVTDRGKEAERKYDRNRNYSKKVWEMSLNTIETGTRVYAAACLVKVRLFFLKQQLSEKYDS